MNRDLKKIKKKYGEGMAKFCRSEFSTILETEGLLYQVLIDNFEPNHELFSDILENDLERAFKNYIYSFVDKGETEKVNSLKSPKELMSEAGYDLYECKSEEDIQSFKKYYAMGEKLCTFKGGRLNRCRVFFAVKKDVDDIKRKDFKHPQRQDEYGTSVISIQFTRDTPTLLSIKNRYNHKVNNPDATFSNDLDNIMPGLTDSFEKKYGIMLDSNFKGDFEIPNYVKARNGKFYKYNYEINNIYYCPDNIIIDYGKVIKLPKEKYILLNYFVLNLQSKKLFLYDKYLKDSFTSSIPEIEKVIVLNNGCSKEIRIIPKNDDTKNNDSSCYVGVRGFEYNPKMIDNSFIKEPVVITLDKRGRMIGLVNNNILKIEDDFLWKDNSLVSVEFSRVLSIDRFFLSTNEVLEKFKVPNVLKIKSHCLQYNKAMKKLYLPSVLKIGDYFLHDNKMLEELSCPNLKCVGDRFLNSNNSLTCLELPKLKKAYWNFMLCNDSVVSFYAPNLKKVLPGFFEGNRKIEYFYAPKVKSKSVVSRFNKV